VAGAGNFLFAITSRQALGTTQTVTQWISGDVSHWVNVSSEVCWNWLSRF